jgi:hypothetical protein
MPKSTDKLAFALATPEPLSRQYFRGVFDHLYLTDAAPAGYSLDDIDRYRRATELNLEALSICDFEFRDRQTVHSCPPYLGLLPQAGFPTAALFGARTPFTLGKLLRIGRENRHAASVTVKGQPGFPLLPNRVRIEARDLPTLRAIAQAASMPFLEATVSWLLLSHAHSVEEYTTALTWAEGTPDLNWRRNDFGALTLSFGPVLADAPLHLSRYLHPQQEHRQVFYLVDGGRSAEVEPAWARYYILHRFGQNVLMYDERLGVVLLPPALPLPRLLARGLVACSGFAPQEVTLPSGRAYRAFVQVPQSHVDLLARKLGQTLARTRLLQPPRVTND